MWHYPHFYAILSLEERIGRGDDLHTFSKYATHYDTFPQAGKVPWALPRALERRGLGYGHMDKQSLTHIVFLSVPGMVRIASPIGVLLRPYPKQTRNKMMSITNTPKLETERLILRQFNENDVEALFAIYSDEEVNTYLPWFPLKSLKEAVRFYEEKYAEAYRQANGYKYAICLKSDNFPIGYVNVGDGDSYDFGYGLRKEYWHKGIVTEASKAVIDQVKKTDIPYITATHDVNNPRSGNVMKNVGMTYSYSYEEQWQPKDILVTFRMYQLNFDGHDDRVYKKYWDNSSVRFIETNIL